MFWTIVFTILFLWVLSKIPKYIKKKFYDPEAVARRIIAQAQKEQK